MSRNPLFRLLLGTVALAALAAVPAAAQTRLLRYPDIHGDKVVFCYAGDLWLASANGGTAWRLTAHPGLELFPKFSPDGRWIAFTGQYDGDEQVYVVPTEGGVPRQLTFFPARGPLTPRWGYDNQVYGWTGDGKAVLFRTLRDGWDLGESRLYTAPIDGGLPEALPMPWSGGGDFSPDGKRVVYSPLARDFRTWKRYAGGWAQDLYVFDLASHEQESITNNPRTDRDPMWIGDKIYFASDRDGTLNLYVYDPKSRQTSEVTHSHEWDVRWPSKGDSGEIVYELGGQLQVFETASGASRPISILVPDDGVSRRPSHVSAAKQIEDFEVSPKGERALFAARGDIFTAPIEKGDARNLTRSPGTHDRAAVWSPDGSTIAYLSDASGEEEIWTVPQDGSAPPHQVTSGGHARRFNPRWSPDGKRIAFRDKDGRLWVTTVADGKLVEVARDAQGFVGDYTWSPDSAWLAFSLSTDAGLRSLYLWSVAEAKLHPVTGDGFYAGEPVWDPAGKFLYYLAAREMVPQISDLEFNYAVNREIEIFALTLAKDGPSPFPPQSDEVTVEKKADEAKAGAPAAGKAVDKDKDKGKDQEKGKDKEKGKDAEKAEEKAPPPVKIDLDGLAARVTAVPVEADNYFGLSANADSLFVVRSGAPFYGRPPSPQPALTVFSLKERKLSVLAEGIDGYTLSADGSKLLVAQDGAYNLYDAKADAQSSKKTVSTDGLAVDRVPAEEWTEIFNEVWRRYRDYFYVANMNGYDWKALGDRYRALLPYVAHRSDLNYVLGEMVAELNNSHSYIAGGDWESPVRPHVALPGARFALDRAAGRYKIAKIFAGENDEERYRSPLTEVGVDAHVGDYVLAIDGVDLGAHDNPYRLLRNRAGSTTVELTLNAKPSLDGARKVKFRPRDSESELIYDEWVAGNRERVAKMTNGRVGYLHIPDMGEDGIREFIKWYYPQVRKEGLVIDERANGGGNVSQMLIERLSRQLLSVDVSRTAEQLGTYPSATFYGSMVCLIDETTASDGDIFAAMFRQAGLGSLIGKRTWGGVVGISGHGPLIDGGEVYVPEAGTASVDGKWIVEGHGVDPDIVVENDPKAVLEGRDPQLERGVAEVLKAMAAHPKKLPSRPADPVKTQ